MTELSAEQKKKVLDKLVSSMQKKHGGDKFALSYGKDRKEDMRFQFIPTPSENVNAALGGGFARSRISEVAGEFSSGKTSLLLETIAQDMKEDPTSYWLWLESEGSFDPEYAYDQKGIDPERLLVREVSDNGAEEALDDMEMLIRSNAIKGIVVNSIAALTPKKEFENSVEKQEVALS
jgi:recombination protein RecA